MPVSHPPIPRSLVYGTLSPEAVKGKAAFQQLIRESFAQHEVAQFTPINPEFRVAGTSAAAWGPPRAEGADPGEGLPDLPRPLDLYLYQDRHGLEAGRPLDPRLPTAQGSLVNTKTDTGRQLVALSFSPL